MVHNSTIVLIGLWILGLMTSYTFGGLIHILLVMALFISVVSLLQGKRVF